MKSKGGNFVVKYCMNLSDEKKETAIKIALESKGNVRKRKIAVPLLMILGIVIIFSSIFLRQILYLIFDYPHKHYTFKHFEV